MPVVIDERDLPAEFVCGACHHAWDPDAALACHACEDVYCRGCVEELEAKSGRCANAACDVAMSVTTFTAVHRAVRNLADAKVAVKCGNFVYGCTWTGVRSDAGVHERSCTRERPAAALYVDTVPQDLVCPICCEPLLDPLQLDQCDHMFCGACIQRSLASATPDRCPACSAACATTQRVPKQIHAALDALRVRCVFSAPDPRDCRFVGPRKQYLQHVRDCANGTAASAPATQPAPAAPAAPAPANPAIAVRVLSDIPSLLADQAEPQEITAMVHLQAPTLESLEERRQGITLSAVIDVSGSMRGSKIALMKEALQFMVTQLGPNDSFGIITFATDVNEPLALQKMTPAVKAAAGNIINDITATSCTNLSGGLFAGIDQVCNKKVTPAFRKKSGPLEILSSMIASTSSGPKTAQHVDTLRPSDCAEAAQKPAGPTAVMLFTDGQANEGICDRSQLFAALKGRLTDAAHVVVHTFGFGTDHDALLLQGIAEQSQGSYYFIKDKTVLKESFADCLGGLVSVVSTGLTLRMTVLNGAACEVAQVMTKYPVTAADDGALVVAIKDLYSGESRDVPVQLKVRTAGVAAGAVVPLLAWVLEYHSTIDERAHVERCESATRAADAKYSGAADVTVDEQRNRFLAAVALEEARKAAESRNFELAKQHIAACQVAINGTASAETTYTAALQREMCTMMDAVRDEDHYAAEGSRGINQVMMRHQQQRCNDSRETDAAMYQTSWKAEMKRRAK